MRHGSRYKMSERNKAKRLLLSGASKPLPRYNIESKATSDGMKKRREEQETLNKHILENQKEPHDTECSPLCACGFHYGELPR